MALTRRRERRARPAPKPAPLTPTPILDVNFPPLPRTVVEVAKLRRGTNEDPDTRKLVEIVYSDPVMAAAVLRRVNSAYYGLRNRVSDPGKAIFLLGFNEVCDIVQAASLIKLYSILKSERQGVIFDHILKVSIGAAYFARLLADNLRLPQRNLAYTTGLLHNMGRLVLLYNRPNDYEHLFDGITGVLPSAESEHVVFETDHPTLGGMATERWHLMPEITEAIKHYPWPGRNKDTQGRLFGFGLHLSVIAAEHLCLHTPPQDLLEEGKTTQSIMARTLNIAPKAISELIAQERKQVFNYVRSMVSPK